MSTFNVQQQPGTLQPPPQPRTHGIWDYRPDRGSAATLEPDWTATSLARAHDMVERFVEISIAKNLQWGATYRGGSVDKWYRLYDTFGHLRRCYEIDTIVYRGARPDGKALYMRTRDVPQLSREQVEESTEEQNDDSIQEQNEDLIQEPDPPVHYGLFLDMNVNTAQRETRFIAAYHNLDPAMHDMRVALTAYPRTHSRIAEEGRMIMRCFSANDELQAVYRVEPGRLVQGSYMSEEDWRRRAAAPSTRVPVLRRPDPVSQVPAVQVTAPAPRSPSSASYTPAPVLRTETLAPSTPSLSLLSPSPSLRTTAPLLRAETPTLRTATPAQRSPSPTLHTPLSTLPTPLPAPQIPSAVPHTEPSPQPDNEHVEEDAEELWCFCRKPDTGTVMIECGNGEQCPYKWFHLRCAGLFRRPPENQEWHCETCTKSLTRAQEV